MGSDLYFVIGWQANVLAYGPEQLPQVRNTFEFVSSIVFKSDTGSGDEVLYGA